MSCVIDPERLDKAILELMKLNLKVLKYDTNSIDCLGKFSGSTWLDVQKLGFKSFDIFLSFDEIGNNCFICIRLLL